MKDLWEAKNVLIQLSKEVKSGNKELGDVVKMLDEEQAGMEGERAQVKQ